MENKNDDVTLTTPLNATQTNVQLNKAETDDVIKGNGTCCSSKCVKDQALSYFPIVRFIRRYKVRQYIAGDVLAGITVSFMHLPQAMAFGVLSSLRPIYGLYTTFFPVLFYVIFGTSPHISFGTNAVLALLTKATVEREADVFTNNYKSEANSSENGTSIHQGPDEAEILAVKVGAAMACSFFVGIMLTVMGVARLGLITSYLSTSFIGGFTTAAAFHIASSQVPLMFGIKVKSFSGAGKLVLMYIDLFKKIGTTKVVEIVIAAICVVTLLLVKVCINERFKDKMKMPIPIDLVVVLLATVISHFAKFEENLGVNIVGQIPNGFQAPVMPRFENIGGIISDSFIMAILILAITITLAKLTANKHGIQIDDNQELVAYGTGNLFSSFFGCFPAATAPPRTMILSSLGAKTTLNGIPTAVFFLLVILLIGQLFVSLPMAVLAAMIIVSMKDLLLQYRNLPHVWRVNKYDFIIWVCTNSFAILLDLPYGLMVGIIISLLLVVIQNQRTSGSLINSTSGYDVDPAAGIEVFRFPSNIYFATADRFKSQLFASTVNPQLYKKRLSKLQKQKAENRKSDTDDVLIGITDENKVTLEKPECVILDMSMVCYIDMAGSNVLQLVVNEFRSIEVPVYVASLNEEPSKTLEAAGFFKTLSQEYISKTVKSALESATHSDESSFS